MKPPRSGDAVEILLLDKRERIQLNLRQQFWVRGKKVHAVELMRNKTISGANSE